MSLLSDSSADDVDSGAVTVEVWYLYFLCVLGMLPCSSQHQVAVLTRRLADYMSLPDKSFYNQICKLRHPRDLHPIRSCSSGAALCVSTSFYSLDIQEGCAVVSAPSSRTL